MSVAGRTLEFWKLDGTEVSNSSFRDTLMDNASLGLGTYMSTSDFTNSRIFGCAIDIAFRGTRLNSALLTFGCVNDSFGAIASIAESDISSATVRGHFRGKQPDLLDGVVAWADQPPIFIDFDEEATERSFAGVRYCDPKEHGRQSADESLLNLQPFEMADCSLDEAAARRLYPSAWNTIAARN
jgi:hypothetical protein